MKDIDEPEVSIELKEFLKFILSNQWREQLKQKSLPFQEKILIQGARGTGKSILLKWLSKLIENIENLNSIEINCIKAFEIEQDIFEWLQKKIDFAIENQPSVILIDDFELIAAKRKDRDVVSRRICELFEFCIDHLKNSNANVSIIGTTVDFNECEPCLLRNERFSTRFSLLAPTSEQATAIVRRRLTQLLAHDNNATTSSIDALTEQTVELAKGKVGAELEQLCDLSALIALKDLQQEILTVESLRKALNSKNETISEKTLTTSTPPSSIVGLDSIWTTLHVSVIEPLLDWSSFKRIGVSRADGVLLYGPSGCGKSLLARALADATSLPLIEIKGPELLRAEMGESEKQLRAAFNRARAKAPCILLIDQLEAIARSRDNQGGASSNGGTTQRVLASLLTEMDGIVSQSNDEKRRFTIIATTNRKDLLDVAVTRPGRFDLSLHVPLPDASARRAILHHYLSKLTLSNSLQVDDVLDRLVDGTAQASGADLAALAREAGMSCLRRTLGKQVDATVTPMVVEQDIWNALDSFQNKT